MAFDHFNLQQVYSSRFYIFIVDKQRTSTKLQHKRFSQLEDPGPDYFIPLRSPDEISNNLTRREWELPWKNRPVIHVSCGWDLQVMSRRGFYIISATGIFFLIAAT